MRIGNNVVREGQVEWQFGHPCAKKKQTNRKNQLKVQNQISQMVGTDVQSQQATFSQREGEGRREEGYRQGCKGLTASFLLLGSYCQLLIMNPLTQVWSKGFFALNKSLLTMELIKNFKTPNLISRPQDMIFWARPFLNDARYSNFYWVMAKKYPHLKKIIYIYTYI